jgi:hypothetical protein
VLDGELVAWGDDGLPSFPRLCDRVLHRRRGIPVSLLVFDVLEVEALPTLKQPYRERRAIPEALELGPPALVDDEPELLAPRRRMRARAPPAAAAHGLAGTNAVNHGQSGSTTLIPLNRGASRRIALIGGKDD